MKPTEEPDHRHDEKPAFRDWLALIVTLGGGYLLYVSPPGLQAVVVSMLTMVLSFYFGSSQSNAANRKTIDRMVEANAAAATTLAAKVPKPPEPPPAGPQPVVIENPEPVPVRMEPPP